MQDKFQTLNSFYGGAENAARAIKFDPKHYRDMEKGNKKITPRNANYLRLAANECLALVQFAQQERPQ